MNFVGIAILLGLVEGITEFIPVSSTGHLVVAARLLGFQRESTKVFEIFIQLGAILAVVHLERRRFVALLAPRVTAGFGGLRGCWLLGLTTAPALIVGLLFHKHIEQFLEPKPVALALFVGGLAILAVEYLHPPQKIHDLDQITWKHALLIGLSQCFAMWPGISRSAATICCGLLCGLSRRTAAVYSFFAAVPVITAAVGYDLMKNRHLLHGSDVLPFAAGFAVSFVAAWATVRLFVALLGRFTLRPYALYRMAVAPLVYFFVS